MSRVYTTPPHLRPVTLWQCHLADGRVASATLAPTADSCAVVWYLGESLQDAAQFQDREAVTTWAEDLRRILLAPVLGWRERPGALSRLTHALEAGKRSGTLTASPTVWRDVH
jgi:hypothetical protein